MALCRRRVAAPAAPSSGRARSRSSQNSTEHHLGCRDHIAARQAHEHLLVQRLRHVVPGPRPRRRAQGPVLSPPRTSSTTMTSTFWVDAMAQVLDELVAVDPRHLEVRR